MFITYKYYDGYQTESGDEYDMKNDVLKEIDYFKILDNFYRFEITFEDDEFFCGKFLYVELSWNKNNPFYYLIRNDYDLEHLIKKDVKTINLSDCDTREITLSDIEQWKRKIINEQHNKKTKVRLLNPTIFRSLITFYIFFLTLNLDLTINLIMIYLTEF